MQPGGNAESEEGCPPLKGPGSQHRPPLSISLLRTQPKVLSCKGGWERWYIHQGGTGEWMLAATHMDKPHWAFSLGGQQAPSVVTASALLVLPGMLRLPVFSSPPYGLGFSALPREAWPGHPRKSTSIITLFSLLGPVTSFSKFVCVCVCFFAGENCRPFVGRHCTFLVIWHIHCPTQSAPDTRAARLREDLLSQRI